MIPLKLLITGASGFIGKHLTEYFSKQDYISGVVTLSRSGNTTYNLDITNESDVQKCLQSVNPDAIIHLAANPLTKLDESNPTQIVKDNIIGTQNVLHHAPAGCRFALASTVVVYGDLPNRFQEHLVCQPTSVYGVTKLAAEGLVSSYTSMDRVCGVSLRVCATVGNGLSHGILMDFIRKAKETSPTLQVFGEYPGTCKPYIHIEDVISAFEFLTFKRNKLIGPFNVCPSDELSAFKVAGLVLDTLNIDKSVEFLGEKTIWKGDNKLIQASAARIERLGWNRKYPTSADAIVQTVKEYIQ